MKRRSAPKPPRTILVTSPQVVKPLSRFDTRAVAEELVTAGFPERQADVLVCSLVRPMKCRLAITAVI